MEPDINSIIYRDAIAAASFSVQKLIHYTAEVKNSVYHRHIWSVTRPLANMPDRITQKMFPANSVIYYPRLFRFPRFTHANDRYDPQAQFWRKYRDGISRLPAPTAHVPLPITASLRETPASFEVESLATDVAQAVIDFEAHILELISCGYPRPSNLQAEQLKHVQLLQFAIYHLQVAIIREDIAHQMFLYNAVNSVIKTLRLLTYFDYVVRECSHYGS